MNWGEALGYLGALVTIVTYSMKTMIPLRIAGLCANVAFLTYGYFNHAYPSLFLHAVLLPINSTRLYQMLQLVDRVKAASRGDLSMDWLKPFMSKRHCKKGETLFRAGDVASAMFYTVTGRYRLVEAGVDVGPGEVIGEIGLIAPDNRRTQTVECIEDGELLTISYDEVKQLYYQSPKFGFYFLQLTSRRLFRDINRLEERLAAATRGVVEEAGSARVSLRSG
jgi:hypothetical protein